MLLYRRMTKFGQSELSCFYTKAAEHSWRRLGGLLTNQASCSQPLYHHGQLLHSNDKSVGKNIKLGHNQHDDIEPRCKF